MVSRGESDAFRLPNFGHRRLYFEMRSAARLIHHPCRRKLDLCLQRDNKSIMARHRDPLGRSFCALTPQLTAAG